MTGTKNSSLNSAKSAKQDEFYTQFNDVYKEMNAYVKHNPDVFRGKTVLLPCDDPEWSNFTTFFVTNFHKFGLKKLISTSYVSLSPVQDGDEPLPNKGKIFTMTDEIDKSDPIDLFDLDWGYLEGDGDYRSEEITALRDEADMVITNPPFSLFRDFITWIKEDPRGDDLKFAVIGSINAITYSEVFPFIKNNTLWMGATGNSTPMAFRVPMHIELKEEDTKKAAKMGYETEGNQQYTTLGNTCWFTNIEHGVRGKTLDLSTMEENLQSNKKIQVKPNSYVQYDNYDAIEIPSTSGIPSDYNGNMGVPISFLDKHNPDQFDIVDRLNTPVVNGKKIYKRIIIKHAE